MGHVKMPKNEKHFEFCCKMEGAIMVSNRAIKQECIVKNLFGLPSHMINLIKKIKAGMLLFLFEHEERKLYGVFEATCDGAMNIVPDAFHFSGKSLPAQVLFRRVWMCRPLCEDEFCHAIDNYRSPEKFDFSLSYDQVFMLVQLFYLRRINITHNLNHIPNKIIRMFEKDCNNIGKSSSHFVKTLNCHLADHELHLQSKASLNASINAWISACSTYDQHYPSRHEISRLFKDPVSNADFSNSADVSFERYDQTHPIGTSVQESMNEEVINSFSSYCTCCDTKNDSLDINASKSVIYDEPEEAYPFIKSKLQSDVEVKRTSVFSRLSIDPKTAVKRKSFSGCDSLIMMAESSKQSKNPERNTRRRSTSMLLSDDETLYQHKHDMLELLSAKEKNKPENGSKHVDAETKVVPHNESDNISACLKNSLPSECNQGKAATDDTEKDYGCRKKKVTSRNLLWFLQKTKDLKTGIC